MIVAMISTLVFTVSINYDSQHQIWILKGFLSERGLRTSKTGIQDSTLEFWSAGGVALVLNPGKDERPKKVDAKLKHKEVIDLCTL